MISLHFSGNNALIETKRMHLADFEVDFESQVVSPDSQKFHRERLMFIKVSTKRGEGGFSGGNCSNTKLSKELWRIKTVTKKTKKTV